MTKRKVSPNGDAIQGSSTMAKKSKKMPEVVCEVKEEEEFNDEFLEQINSEEPKQMYKKEDLIKLFERVQAQLPKIAKVDQVHYGTSLEKVDFENVKFGDFSAEECKTAMKFIFKYFRKVRTLVDMLGDFDEFVNGGEKFNRYQMDLSGPLKKPPNPVMLYMNEQFRVERDKHPNLSHKEFCKLLSENWKKMSEKKKQKYHTLYQERMEEYQKQISEHFEAHPEAELMSGQKKRKDKTKIYPDKPRKPIQLYLEKQLRQYGPEEQDNKELIESIKKDYSNLSEKKMLKYIRKVAAAEEEYFHEMEALIAMNPTEEPAKAWRKTVLTKDEQSLWFRYQGRPERPPGSGYILFTTTLMPQLSEFEVKERLVIIAKRWKELDEQEKKRYQDEALRLNEEYVVNFEEFLKTLDPAKAEFIRNQESGAMQKRFTQKANPAELLKAGKVIFRLDCAEVRKELAGQKSKKTIETIVDQKWAQLTEDEQFQYLEKARNFEAYREATDQSSNDTKPHRYKELGKFMKKLGASYTVNGFSLYMRDLISEPTEEEKPYNERLKDVSEKWKNASALDKEFYTVQNVVNKKIGETMWQEFKDAGEPDDWFTDDKIAEYRQRVVAELKKTKLANGSGFPMKKLMELCKDYKDSDSQHLIGVKSSSKKSTTQKSADVKGSPKKSDLKPTSKKASPKKAGVVTKFQKDSSDSDSD